MTMQIQIINPKKTKFVPCPTEDRRKWCGKPARAELHSKKNEKWVIIRECEKRFGGCGRKEMVIVGEYVDVIQPSSPLFELVYGSDLFRETEETKKQMAWDKEKRKETLDAKYDRMFKKPWERDFVKKKVLGEDT